MVLGVTDLSKWHWRMSFTASAVINESFGSHHGQLFCLRLCKIEGKHWSYLETRLAFYFFCYQWVRSSLGVWVLQIRTEAARTIIWEQHQQMKSRLLLCPFCCVAELLLQLHSELDSGSWNSVCGVFCVVFFFFPSGFFSWTCTQLPAPVHHGVTPNTRAKLRCIV